MSNNQISDSQTAMHPSSARDSITHGSTLKLGASPASGHQPIPEAKHLNASIAPFSIEKCRDLK
jgi:hypothetical protein